MCPRNSIAIPRSINSHSTIIKGDGKLVVGTGPVRTGVTAILPRGKDSSDQVFAAWFSLNGPGGSAPRATALAWRASGT